LEPPTIHLGSPEPAIRITGPLPEGHACICVLIPHVPEHYLVGGMTDLLKQALVQVAAKNHWKVSQVLVRPQYLQWTTETSEEILPDKVAELVRKRLSADIFKQYPALKKQNRSGNFWSTDVLALQGSEPIPAQRLRAFTRQARVNAAPLKKQ
ncbi:MAG TPA: hypothetical protein VFF78_00640, partial [Anaerolineaceae bacterium]|nr:hypothetical protein [Anaerolineaceae bacterium]